MQNLQDLLSRYNRHHKIKIVGGLFTKKNEFPFIGSFTFNDILKNLHNDHSYKFKHYDIESTYYNDNYICEYDKNSKISKYFMSRNDGFVYLYEKNVKVVLEYKETIKEQNWGKPDKVLQKKHYVFTHKRDNYEILMEKTQNLNMDVIYIIFNKKPTLIEINKKIEYYNDSLFSKKLLAKQIGVNKFNNIVNKNTSRTTPLQVGKKPEDLSIDMIPTLSKYYIYPKIDGIGYSLFFAGNTIQLINPTDVIKFATLKNDYLENTILQGELLNDKFYIYDIYFFKGKKIQKPYYDDRRDIIINEILKNIDHKDKIELIPYYYIWEHKKLFSNMYKNDGIIFIPIHGINKPSYKWKPKSKMTIDFLVKKSPYNVTKDEYYLYVGGENNKYKYSITTIIAPGESRKITGKDVIPDLYIVEFYYDFKRYKWIPVKVRYDKIEPNYYTVANDIWMHIIDIMTDEKIKKWLDYVIYDDDSEATIVSKMCSLYRDTYHLYFFDHISTESAKIFVQTLRRMKNKNDRQKDILRYLS